VAPLTLVLATLYTLLILLHFQWDRSKAMGVQMIVQHPSVNSPITTMMGSWKSSNHWLKTRRIQCTEYCSFGILNMDFAFRYSSTAKEKERGNQTW